MKDYVNLIPQINDKNSWEFDTMNRVVITVYETGGVDKIKEKMTRKKINCKEYELDRYGSFVWQQIDGNIMISDIIENIIETFKEERELATQRAIMFFDMLRRYGLISFTNGDLKSVD